ncbi:hypothetical protein AAW31_10345 [Nitrosomonas communis]|nr:hypothetical protein AAW31_10345 [Nitrosomonas communis]
MGGKIGNSIRGILISGDGIGSKSGIYLIATPEEDILYIGKATKNNLHHRVWSHLQTPQELENGNWSFPNNAFESFGPHNEYVQIIRNGYARLGVITISNSNLVSLVEVYLHTLHHQKYGSLPFFNKQIG